MSMVVRRRWNEGDRIHVAIAVVGAGHLRVAEVEAAQGVHVRAAGTAAGARACLGISPAAPLAMLRLGVREARERAGCGS